MSTRATRWLVLAAVLGAAAPLASAAVPDEDRPIVATETERRALLDRLEVVVGCARRAGYRVPDPVAVDAGALLPWAEGEPDAPTARAIEACMSDAGVP
jgi:hypothetical protein